ncbi:MAG: hypothetical protein V9G23_03180 [Giesbergeria sp.]
MKVDLPDPDGPMIGDEFAGCDAEIDVPQRREEPGRRVVGLAETDDANAPPRPSEQSHADAARLAAAVGDVLADDDAVAGLQIAAERLRCCGCR